MRRSSPIFFLSLHVSLSVFLSTTSKNYNFSPWANAFTLVRPILSCPYDTYYYIIYKTYTNGTNVVRGSASSFIGHFCILYYHILQIQRGHRAFPLRTPTRENAVNHNVHTHTHTHDITARVQRHLCHEGGWLFVFS